MTTHAEASDSAVAATEFRATFDALGLTQQRVARWFNVGARSIRRWRDGERRVPCGVGIVLRLLAAGLVTIDQVERAAGAIPAQTNGAELGASAPLPGAPAPEQSALAPAAAAALADPENLTTAAKVVALAPGDCRWPLGDPARADFCFCGNSVTERPYCAHHHTLARAAPRTSSGQGVLSYGWRAPATKRLSTGVSSTSCAATAAVVAPDLQFCPSPDRL
jgi:GcrA cell cycle regulator